MDTKETLLDIYSDGGEWEDMEPVIDELIAKNVSLEARLAEAEAIIKENEYNGNVDGWNACPECGATRVEIHAPDCRIFAFLAGGDTV